jgi:hypothetical protein
MWRIALGFAAALLLSACSAPDPQPTAAAPPSFHIGQPVSPGGAEITVLGVELRNSVGGPFGTEEASEGGVLLAVRYSIKNISAKPLSAFSQPRLVLIDPNGTTYKPDIAKSASYATEVEPNQKLFSDLNPGITVHGADVFEVGKDLFNLATWSLAVDNARGARIAMAEPAAPAPPPAGNEQVTAGASASSFAVGQPAAASLRPSPSSQVARSEVRPELPGDPARDRRLEALIENASERDPSGSVQRTAAAGRAERASCPSQACVARSYAREEASMSQWDGAEEIMRDAARH